MPGTDASLLERLRAWTYQRQLLGRAASDPLGVLGELVGVYSTHPSAPLSLLARTPLSAEQLVSLEQSKQIVRVPAMRGSSFLLRREDAAHVLGATRQSSGTIEQRLRYGGLDLHTYQRLTPAVLECTQVPRRPREIAACTGDEAAVLVSRVLAREGRVLRVNSHVRVDQLRWVSTAAWLGAPIAHVDHAEALPWLARRYLHAFGPARLADFAWWSGASRRDAGRAFEALALAEVSAGLMLLLGDAAAFESVQPLDAQRVDVVPKWDAYTMAYAPDGRQRLVADAHIPLVYTSRQGSPGATAGDGLPLVLRGGRAVAVWSHRFDKQRMLIDVQPLPGEHLDAGVLREAFAPMGALMNAAVELSLGAD